MQGNTIRNALAVVYVGALLTACGDEATSPAAGSPAPGASPPKAVAQLASASVIATEPRPTNFAIQAPLNAFFINQPAEMMIRTHARADFAIQRLVTDPGVGGWHTHPGPSFGIVERGTVIITRYTKKGGCVSTAYHAGQAYYEVADEVHRAEVPGPDYAVEYKARFFVPVGGAFGTPVPANRIPDCS